LVAFEALLSSIITTRPIQSFCPLLAARVHGGHGGACWHLNCQPIDFFRRSGYFSPTSQLTACGGQICESAVLEGSSAARWSSCFGFGILLREGVSDAGFDEFRSYGNDMPTCFTILHDHAQFDRQSLDKTRIHALFTLPAAYLDFSTCPRLKQQFRACFRRLRQHNNRREDKDIL
jgi:hypothetical protein